MNRTSFIIGILIRLLVPVTILFCGGVVGWEWRRAVDQRNDRHADAALKAYPYRALWPLMQRCKGLEYSTAACMRFDRDGDGLVTQDDEAIWISQATSTWTAWHQAMTKVKNPAALAERLARDCEAMEP